MDTAQTLRDALDANPEIRLVLDIAARARTAESLRPSIEIGMATEISTIPVNSQGLVPPLSQC